jgi:hypothetical protein
VPKYNLEFILSAVGTSIDEIRRALVEFGEELEISQPQQEESGRRYLVRVIAQDPTIIFDICGQFGKIQSVKVKDPQP